MPAKATLSPPPRFPSPTAARQHVLRVAERLHAMKPDWLVFFREVLGIDGLVRGTFESPREIAAFECSTEYARIRELLDDLRRQPAEPAAERESQRVVTVRMPRSLHETLKAEADEQRVSINTLCIAKLTKLLDAKDRQGMGDESAVAEPAARSRRAR